MKHTPKLEDVTLTVHSIFLVCYITFGLKLAFKKFHIPFDLYICR